jgi:hypothetical protein
MQFATGTKFTRKTLSREVIGEARTVHWGNPLAVVNRPVSVSSGGTLPQESNPRDLARLLFARREATRRPRCQEG